MVDLNLRKVVELLRAEVRAKILKNVKLLLTPATTASNGRTQTAGSMANRWRRLIGRLRRRRGPAGVANRS